MELDPFKQTVALHLYFGFCNRATPLETHKAHEQCTELAYVATLYYNSLMLKSKTTELALVMGLH